MATVDQIIDACILAIGDEIAEPTEMSRVQILALINQCYQYDIGPLLKTLTSATITPTAGIGALPTDYLKVARVYDGVPNTNDPLIQISKIDDKVLDTDPTTQFMLPDNANIWIFGTTPTNTIKMYYYKLPTAVTDSSASTPSDLNAAYHIGVKGIFEAYVKAEYAKRMNNTYDQLDEIAMYSDLLNEIEDVHGRGKRDDTLPTITMEW